MRRAGALWLAVRIALTCRSDAAAALVLAVASAALTFLSLSTVAVVNVSQAQRHRSYALTPRIAPGADRSEKDARSLRTMEPGALPVRRWHEHDIVRSYYSAGPTAADIPGVPRAPGDEEYFASPALKDLMHRDPTVAALFSGKRLVGTIAGAGLVQPHELRAVVGVPRRSAFLVAVSGFGARPFSRDDNSTLNASVASMVLLAVWLPALAVLVIVTRLGSGRRRRRSRALRLLGASARMTRAINALETVVVALPASLLGCLVYSIFIHRVTSIPWTSSGYFSSDAELSAPVYGLVAPIVPLIAGSANAFAAGTAKVDTAVHARPASRIVTLGLVLMVLGVAYLFALPALTHLSSRATLGLWTACGFTAVGLAIAGPRFVMHIASASARRVDDGGILVGLRLNSWASTTSSRLGSLLCVVIVFLLGGLSFMSLLNGGTSSNWERALAAHPKVPVIVNDFGGALTRGQVRDLAPGTAATQVQSATSTKGRRLTVVYADCRDLADLSGVRPVSCTGRPQWIATAANVSTRRRGRLILADGHALELPDRSAVARDERLPEQFNRALLLPGRLAPRRPDRTGSYFYLLAASRRLDVTLARLSAHSPSVEFDLGGLSRESPDDKRFPTQLRWLTAGMVLGLLIGVLALLAAALGDMRERTTTMRGLRVLGAPPLHLLRAHYVSIGAPVVVLGWMGTLCGWLVSRGISAFDDRADIGTHPIALAALAVLMTGLVIATITWPDTARAARPKRGPQRSPYAA